MNVGRKIKKKAIMMFSSRQLCRNQHVLGRIEAAAFVSAPRVTGPMDMGVAVAEFCPEDCWLVLWPIKVIPM